MISFSGSLSCETNDVEQQKAPLLGGDGAEYVDECTHAFAALSSGTVLPADTSLYALTLSELRAYF